jgi:hypothetical protein
MPVRRYGKMLGLVECGFAAEMVRLHNVKRLLLSLSQNAVLGHSGGTLLRSPCFTWIFYLNNYSFPAGEPSRLKMLTILPLF